MTEKEIRVLIEGSASMSANVEALTQLLLDRRVFSPREWADMLASKRAGTDQRATKLLIDSGIKP